MAARCIRVILADSEPLMRRGLRRCEQGGESFHPRYHGVIGVMALGTGAFMPASAGSLGLCVAIDGDPLLSFV